MMTRLRRKMKSLPMVMPMVKRRVTPKKTGSLDISKSAICHRRLEDTPGSRNTTIFAM